MRSEDWVKLYLHSPNTPSLRGAQLKHRDKFTFTLPCYEDVLGDCYYSSTHS